MQENTNKALIINSAILYARLFFMTICGLLTTRFALKALGVNDFGLFSLLGSIITFIAIFNTVMISTSNRFISVAIGRNDINEINTQFNISLIIHLIIAVVTLFIALPIGDFYIRSYLHYNGSIDTAIDVFHFTVIGSIISFIGVPYNGLLIAKENFWISTVTDIITHIFKLGITISLLYCFENKLLIYALTQGLITGIPTLIYFLYCQKVYPLYVTFKLVNEKEKYKEVFSFSGWIAYGAFATIGKSQGAQVLVNSFFNTIMNTALGLANTVNGLLSTFSNSISQPIVPQITKSYATKDKNRCDELLVMSTKFTFLVTLFISIPFLTNGEWIFSIWLGEIPPYVLVFTKLVIVDTLITSLNSGISSLIFAHGNIKLYQISINTLRLLSIIAAYIALKMGGPAYSLFWAYIVFSVIIFFVGQIVLNKTLHYDNRILWKKSYMPSLLVTILFAPFLFVKFISSPILSMVIYQMILTILIMTFGLSKSERKFILKKLH